MKKLTFILALLLINTTLFAKKVKFACDMTGIAINVTGMHISGDFQTVAGFAGGDWNSASTPLTQEGTSDIYSIVVDIPAFTKYEYKFVNGDQFYEAEFVPEPSRVLYNFNDNRWLYVDSLADDTTFVGAILFGQNAPAGLTLVRFYVDMQFETTSLNGVHVAGNFQGWDPQSTILYSFGSNVYEIISYVTTGTYEYKFYNGNAVGTEEIVPGICSVNSNREIAVASDTLLTLVCFGSCGPCLTGIAENSIALGLSVSPNPSIAVSTIRWNQENNHQTVYLVDVTGRKIKEFKNCSGGQLGIEKGDLDAGIYFVKIAEGDHVVASTKLIFE